MKKKILTSGCSFTSGGWETDLCQHYDIRCLARPSAGNKYIADSIIYHLPKDNYDHVLVMWSGLTRLDLPIKHAEYFNDYIGKLLVGETNYIMSGGEAGNWLYHPMAKTLFSSQYKFMTFEDLAILSLGEIIKLQNFLKGRGMSYHFMTYINYWNQPEDWISKNCDRGLNNYPALNDLIAEIDFDHWIFTNNSKDGIFELATAIDSFQEDCFHPGEQAHQQWADLVYSNLVTRDS